MELTPAELTVLGLVIEHPQHGYDLEQRIEDRGIRQWTDIGFSSIYYLLTKLEARGLLRVPEAPGGPRSRRVFHATAAGRAAATRSVLAVLADPQPVPQPFLVGLANLSLLPEQAYAEVLSTRLRKLEARISAVRDAQRAQAVLPRPAREVFSYSLSLLEAERQWLAGRVHGHDDGQD
jgi:DNA-binding PadR family transcriptional regulator